jgi:hypothetical protein
VKCIDWKSQIDSSLPCWEIYREFLSQLDKQAFPDAPALTRLLPAGTANESGLPVRFVPASGLPGVAYEQHIYATGEISTRENNWHDLFNALVWCRFPRLKTAMNAAHIRDMDSQQAVSRGKVRDALTLLDESGALVVGSDRNILLSLAMRDWRSFYRHARHDSGSDCRVFLTGHALLEKMLRPYKSMTAHSLLLQVDEKTARLPADALVDFLDRAVARQLPVGRILATPADVSPLPVMGLEGWWNQGPQDDAFYSDATVFRSPPTDLEPAPVFTL